jgi:hypothetical protein
LQPFALFRQTAESDLSEEIQKFLFFCAAQIDRCIIGHDHLTPFAADIMFNKFEVDDEGLMGPEERMVA